MKSSLSFFLLLFILGGGVSIASFVHAQAGDDSPGNEFGQGVQDAEIVAVTAGLSPNTDILKIISDVILWLLALSAILAMGAFVWGGIMYIMSLGDEGRAGKAKTIIWYAIIGVIVVLLSYVIVAFLQARLTASNPWGVTSAYAAEQQQAGIKTDKGFDSGIAAIILLIDPSGSGLAFDVDILPIILNVINYLLGLVAVLALAAMVWGAIMYILAIGDEGRAEKAKKIILYAIIGVLLAGVSFVIIAVLQRLLITP